MKQRESRRLKSGSAGGECTAEKRAAAEDPALQRTHRRLLANHTEMEQAQKAVDDYIALGRTGSEAERFQQAIEGNLPGDVVTPDIVASTQLTRGNDKNRSITHSLNKMRRRFSGCELATL